MRNFESEPAEIRGKKRGSLAFLKQTRVCLAFNVGSCFGQGLHHLWSHEYIWS